MVSDTGIELGEGGTLVQCRLMQMPWKPMWDFLKKLKADSPYHPAIYTTFGYIPKKDDCTFDSGDTCSSLLTDVVFTIARGWKPPRSPSAF